MTACRTDPGLWTGHGLFYPGVVEMPTMHCRFAILAALFARLLFPLPAEAEKGEIPFQPGERLTFEIHPMTRVNGSPSYPFFPPCPSLQGHPPARHLCQH